MKRKMAIPKILRTGPSFRDSRKTAYPIYFFSGKNGRKRTEEKGKRRIKCISPRNGIPVEETKRIRRYFLFFLTILPLPGVPGPWFDTRHDRAAESADSSPVSSTDLTAKYTRCPPVIPDAAGSNVKDVPVVEEASGVSDAVESPASAAQNIAYRTVFPWIGVPFAYVVTGPQESCHVPDDVEVATLVSPRSAGADGDPDMAAGGFHGSASEKVDSVPVPTTVLTVKYTVW
jgi:hypothetical protein